MTVTYLGSLTVAGAIPGLSAALDTVGDALTNLKATVEAQFSVLASASASVNAQAGAVLAARLAIKVPATADIQAQLDAAVAINASLTAQVSDPSVYLNGLLEGLAEVQATMSALVPSIALSGQLTASASVEVSMQAKLDAINIQLDALLGISTQISIAAQAVASIQGALSIAVSAVVGALNLYLQFTGALVAGGVNAFLYTGTLGNLGTDLDAAASVDTGFSTSLVVRAPIFIYDAANAGAVQGMQLALSKAAA